MERRQKGKKEKWQKVWRVLLAFSITFPYPLRAMPLIESAIKRARQNTVRRERLQPFKTIMKTAMRRMVDLSKEGKKKEAAALLPQVFKAIDTAAKKRIIHLKNAARKKARMSRLVA